MAGRRKILRVSTGLLLDLFRTGLREAVRVEGGLPADAEFDGASYDPTFGVLNLRFRSEEFPVVEDGCAAPDLNLTATRAEPAPAPPGISLPFRYATKYNGFELDLGADTLPELYALMAAAKVKLDPVYPSRTSAYDESQGDFFGPPPVPDYPTIVE